MKELKKYLMAGLLAICFLSAAQAQQLRGDMNLNGFPYEVADWVMLYKYFLGQESFSPQQIEESDLNFDTHPASIADFIGFLRVMFGSTQPVTGLVHPAQHKAYDLMAGQFQTASPGDTVNFPIYFRNSESASGLSFNLKFDSNKLSLMSYDTVSSRLSFWDFVDTVANNYGTFDSAVVGDLNFVQDAGQFFMFAFCYQCFDNRDFYSKIVPPGQGGILNLKFEVSISAPINTLLPIEFVTEENLGHYNAYANTQDPSRLIIPSVFSAGIYTGVPEAGDVFTDGKKNVIDIVYLVNHIFKGFLPPNPYSLGDLNSDSQITLVDVMILVNQIY
jgi:hypothetical protein